MKKFSELVAEDFPGVNPKRFEEWKQAKIEAGRNHGIALGVLAVLVLIFTFVIGVSGFIPAILIIVLIAVSGSVVNEKANRLSKELGITNDMIKKATRN